MGEEEGAFRRGVPFGAPLVAACEDAASFWSWAAAGSGGELGTMLRCDLRFGVALWELRCRRCDGDDMIAVFCGMDYCLCFDVCVDGGMQYLGVAVKSRFRVSTLATYALARFHRNVVITYSLARRLQ